MVRLSAFACALVALIAPAALAQPTVTVRAESRLELEVRRTDGALAVSGALRDDLGLPLRGEDVSLELSHAVASEHRRGAHIITRVVTAGADGVFATRFAVELGDYAVDATYEGAAEHLGTRATRFFDLDRAHLDLRLELEHGTRIDLTEPTQVLTITASSDDGGQALAVSVTDESGGTDLGGGTTDANGVLRLTLESARLGPPAAGRLIVRTRGDATRAEAQSELPVVRFRPTHTTLTLSAATTRTGAAIEASGTLDDGVSPLEREAITIVSGAGVIATVLTDERGRFVARLDESSLFYLEGDVPVVARFDGAAPWLPGSESEPRTLRVQRAMSLGWLLALVPIALAAVVVAWSLRRDPIAPARVRRPDGAPGVALGPRRSLVPSRLDVSGTVRDAISGDPIAYATVRIGEIATRTDARGMFAEQATRAATTIRVEHAEYLPLEASLTLPHRGDHEGMQLRLAGRRALSFAALREVAIELAPDGEIALALTQREVFELLRARGASPPALPELVSRVEIACYAVTPPSDGELAEIRGVAASIVSHAPLRSAQSSRPAAM